MLPYHWEILYKLEIFSIFKKINELSQNSQPLIIYTKHITKIFINPYIFSNAYIRFNPIKILISIFFCSKKNNLVKSIYYNLKHTKVQK